ncbi:hypothetical protein E2320_011302 [Naja naja]|nr:hypothetical protein E2320_011302 [Naja naja]
MNQRTRKEWNSQQCRQVVKNLNCKLEDRTDDGDLIDCKKRPEEGEDLEEEAVHSCDSCLQVFESLSDITEHKINQCQLTGKQYFSFCICLHSFVSDFRFLLQ